MDKHHVHVPLPPDELRIRVVHHTPGPPASQRLQQRLREQGVLGAIEAKATPGHRSRPAGSRVGGALSGGA